MTARAHALAERADDVAQAGLRWLRGQAVADVGGVLRWPIATDQGALDPSLYAGGAGVVRCFLEAHAHGDPDAAATALRGAQALAVDVDELENASYYVGLAGCLLVLDAVAGQLGDSVSARAVRRGRVMLRSRFDGERWEDAYDLIGGNAGIGLVAVALGDLELAELAVEPLLRTAEDTPHGVTWENRRGLIHRRHHVSHGTLGFAQALLTVGKATGRQELTDLGLRAVADVEARDTSDGSGFLVPHSDPQQAPELIDRFSYGWCHGPAGDAHVFRLLEHLTGAPRWRELGDRCWRTILDSGLPERLRPGFWDNNGRCCGTAGVLALGLDRIVERQEAMDFTETLVEDLLHRARVDGEGARWHNVERRAVPPELAPRTGWAMGVAGIVPELLRFLRVVEGRDASYAVGLPDQPQVLTPER